MRKLVAAAVIAATAATSACSRSRAEDGGPTVARNYQVGNFEQIEVAGPYNVTVRTGAGPTVSARGSEKLIEHLVVEVRDGKLLIHPERQKGWFHTGWSFRGKVDLAVTVPQLRGNVFQGRVVTLPDAGSIPTAIRRVLVRGLRPNPALRWPSMDVLLERLHEAAQSLSVHRRLWAFLIAATRE